MNNNNEIDYIKIEEDDVKRLFDLDEILYFQKKHDVQIIRGGDYQYSCYIDSMCYYSALTTLSSLVYGIIQYNKYKISFKVKDKLNDIVCDDSLSRRNIDKIFEKISIKYSDVLDVDVYTNVNNTYIVELIYDDNVFFIEFGSNSIGWFSEINNKITQFNESINIDDINIYKILNNDINEFVNNTFLKI